MRTPSRRARRLRQAAGELSSRPHAELAERLAQVVLDRARADEELCGDLPVGASLRCEARDLRLLWRQLVERLHGSLAGALASRLELGPRALGERNHSEVGEELVGGTQLPACILAPALTSQPLAVQQMRPGEVHAKARRLQAVDRLAIERLGCLPSVEEGPRSRFDAQRPRRAAGARRLAQ